MKPIYPWQHEQWNYLLARKNADKLAHALLLCGNPGLGKLDFALAFAELLLCENKSNEGIACKVCAACQLLKANTHPDLYLIKPEAPGKVLKVEQIRELIQELNKTSKRGGYRVVVINPADAMNKAAANALLKTLEEPLTKVIFMLVSSHIHILPATIISRCQKVVFYPPAISIAKQWLIKKDQTFLQDKFSEFLLNFTNNAPLQVQQLATEAIFKEREQLFTDFWQLYEKKLNIVQCAEQGAKADIKLLLAYFISIVTDIIKLKFNATERFLINIDKLELLNKFAAKLSWFALQKYLDELFQINKLLQSNISFNKQLLLEGLWLSWPS